MNRMSFTTKVATGLAALTLLAGAANAQAPTPKKGGTVIQALGNDPGGLNPVVTTANADSIAGCYIFEGLVTVNTLTDAFEPMLAQSWTLSQDQKTYTFKLRQATWHDGQPVTSEDVRFTYSEVSPKYNTSLAAVKVVESVTAPDPQTVVIKLKEPYGPMLRALACVGGGSILPAHIYKGTDARTNPANQKPVGTGPFKFSEWVRGDHLTFVRNDKYWDQPKPYLDSIIFKIMPNAASRTAALIAGEIDFVSFLYFAPTDMKTIDANPNTKRELSGYPPNMLYLFFNLKKKPFDDLKLREALLVATDRKYIFDNAFFGSGKPGRSPWAKQIAWTDDPSIDYDKSHAFNPEKAAQMLDAAGYKPDANGVRLRMTLNYDPSAPERTQVALALQGMWKRVGIELTPQPLESSVLQPRVDNEHNFDLYMNSYTSRSDPATGVARAYVTSSIGVAFGNPGQYSNPEVDALFEKAAIPADLKERAAIYSQIQKILMRDLPVITLHENLGYDAARKNLVGAWGSLGNARLGSAWLEK